MKRYSIFRKSSRFHWSNNKIVLTLMSGVGIIIVVKSVILRIEHNEFDNYLTRSLVGIFFLGLILKLFRTFKPDPLHGSLDGFLSFETDRIVAGEEVYDIIDIAKVRITNDDYYGKSNGRGSGFNSNLSNGVDNVCEIRLNNGIVHCYNYELYYPHDLQKSSDALISYYKAGKIDFGNLTNILALDKDEIANLAK